MILVTDAPADAPGDHDGTDQVYTLVLSHKEAVALHGAAEEKYERLCKIHGRDLGDWGLEKRDILRTATTLLPGEEP